MLKSFINEKFSSLTNSTFSCSHGLQSTAIFSVVCSERTPRPGTRPTFDPSLYGFQLNNFRFQLVPWQTEPVLSLKYLPSAQLLRGKARENNPCLHVTPALFPLFAKTTENLKEWHISALSLQSQWSTKGHSNFITRCLCF